MNVGALLERIDRIHADAGKFVLVVTGGGTSAISNLMAIAGASNTILEASVPYSPEALADFLGYSPEKACSTKTAQAMAMTAYLRARDLSPSCPTFGLACTAALATNRKRRGSDACFVAIQSATASLEIHLSLDDKQDRIQQESKCCQLILDAMYFATGVEDEFQSQNSSYRFQRASIGWQNLLSGHSLSTLSESEADPTVLFPGSFNPFHDGHQLMLQIAEKITGERVVLEISTHNVDKAPLDFIDMADRESNLKNRSLVFTRAATFIEKSQLFPGVIFVVGVDTMKRIADQKYYGGNENNRDLAIDMLVENKNRFLVFGRLSGNAYETLPDLELPPRLLQISDAVSETDFRRDISSSEIRERR